jgi:dTDP-4-amino-4,6-dideoxygalactose transaminase
LEELEAAGKLRRPVIPDRCGFNAHIYHLILPTRGGRDGLLAHLQAEGIGAVFHYVPLHSSPAGKKMGRAGGAMEVTDRVSGSLLRLPLWPGLPEVPRILRAIEKYMDK